MFSAALAMLAAVRYILLVIPLIQKSVQFSRRADDDMSAASAVSAVRAAFRDKLLPPEAYAASPAVTGLYMYFYVINELHKQKRQSVQTAF
jgi:hypothetical protein